MNASDTRTLSDALEGALTEVALDDKYVLERGRAFMSGTQALVRLPMLQRDRDLRAGLNTAGFVTGYRGSPLGGLDQALWRAKKRLAAHHVVFQPGLNEDLAATSVWGSQRVNLSDKAKYDGGLIRASGLASMMRKAMARFTLALAGVFVALAASAQPELPAVSGAAQAAEFLAAADSRQRAAALMWLSEHGAESDATRVAARLHDPHPVVRALAGQVIWALWSRSGDREIDQLLELGTRQMGGGALADAIDTFNEVIRRRPAFAEGWNKRATAHFLAGEYRKSIADCDEVLRRNPIHFGALSGYGQNHLQLREYRLALDYFRRALAINPEMRGVQANIRALEHQLEQPRGRST